MKKIFVSGLMTSLLTFSSIAQAEPLDAEHRYRAFSGQVSTCDDTGILGDIQSRFNQKESGFWNSSLTILSVDHIRETGLRNHGASFIPYRYCAARALMSDQSYRSIAYAIGEHLGMIGWGNGVHFCVEGLDRNLSYAPNCRSVRP